MTTLATGLPGLWGGLPHVTAGLPPLAGSVIRQSLIPMVAGYLVLMVPLALGLIRLRRLQKEGSPHPGPGAPRGAHGWVALIRQVAVTVVGGYLLLMAVVAGYYYGVVRVGGSFLDSAVTGPALLIGLTMPIFAVASWLYERRRRRRHPAMPDTNSPRNCDTAER